MDMKNKPSCIFRNFEFFSRFSWVKYFHIRFTDVQWDYLINCTIQYKEIPCTSWKLTWKYLTHKKHLKNSKFRKMHDGLFFVSVMRYCVSIFSSKLLIKNVVVSDELYRSHHKEISTWQAHRWNPYWRLLSLSIVQRAENDKIYDSC